MTGDDKTAQTIEGRNGNKTPGTGQPEAIAEIRDAGNAPAAERDAPWQQPGYERQAPPEARSEIAKLFQRTLFALTVIGAVTLAYPTID